MRNYVCIGLHQRTFDKLRNVCPKGTTYSAFLEGLMDAHGNAGLERERSKGRRQVNILRATRNRMAKICGKKYTYNDLVVSLLKAEGWW